VRDSSASQWDETHIAPRPLRAFANGIGDFTGLTHTHAYIPFVVAYHHDRAEAKAPAAFHHLGRACNLHNTLVKFFDFFNDFWFPSRHVSSSNW
jgi:hypothetical protein